MKNIELIMLGGIIQDWDIPKGQKVILKDYDIDGVEEDLKQDDAGDLYQEIILNSDGTSE